MKKTYLLLILIIFGSSVFAQNCTNCNGTSTSGLNASAIGTSTIADGNSAFAGGYFSKATGNNSFAFGEMSYADSNNSIALGTRDTANWIGAIAIGMNARAGGTGSIALGNQIQALGHYSIVIGTGFQPTKKLRNPYTNSLMIGFNSMKPTLFVSSSLYYDKTGRIGIGNVTDPQAKLHLRADDGEDAAIYIEPNNWNAGEMARLILGNTFHSITTNNSEGMKFESENNFIFNGKNSGFGVEEPKAKVHINGNLLFEHSLNGIIMKSEDGNCWKGRISNNGELIFAQVDCETLSSTENLSEPKHSEIFIYPNPTNGHITVEYTGNRKNLRLEIKSISGLLVATYKISKGENRKELNNISDQMIVASVFTKTGELISTNKVVIKK